ncbi:MAG: TatD family hydrolase [Clostridia bacterium]|nr:TatD family hydrolase [Clostridia bacterium]
MIDSHAHYLDTAFDADRDTLLRSLAANGVECVVEAGTDEESSLAARELAHEYENVYFAAGLHPEYAEKHGDIPAWLPGLLMDEKCVAIGEIGLDHHYDTPSREVQRRAFALQLELARDVRKPVVVHDREAHAECMELVKAFPTVRGVFHSFSGSAETARELVKLGWYISFSGVITFKNAVKTVQAAEAVPLERILTETDCPYLAPHPFRGKRNDSTLVKYIIEKLAQIKGAPYDEIERATAQNARDFYGIA